MQHTGWGQAPGASDLPSDMVLASQALAEDQTLQQYLGKENAGYWLKTRRHEWLSFQEQASEPSSGAPTLWEFERGFAKL
jgi:glutamine synthetase